MSFTHTINFSYTTSGGSTNVSNTVTADAESRQEIAVASDASDLEVDVHIPNDEIKAFIIQADQDLTIEYNDGTGTQGSISLTADMPLIWYNGAPWSIANILGYAGAALDITKFYVTAASSPAAATTLYVTTLYDSTP